MNDIITNIIATILLISVIYSCQNNIQQKLKPLSDDISIEYINDYGNPKPKLYNVLSFTMNVKNSKDSTILSYLDPAIVVEKDSTWNTTDMFFSVINRLGEQDSVIVTLPAQKAFNGQVPPQMNATDTINMEIKIVKIYENSIAYYNEKWGKDMNKIIEKNKDKIVSQEKLIQDWLNTNNMVAEKTKYGVFYVTLDSGDDSKDASILPFDKVKIHYTLRNLEGKVIDSSDPETAKEEGTFTEERAYNPYPITVGMSNVIKGWHEGIPYFRKHGKGKLLIPSYFAYGERGYPPDIPPDSPLIFDINIIDLEYSDTRKRQSK